jgi:DNA-binding transcriptional regulator LsrR (DeoR family)
MGQEEVYAWLKDNHKKEGHTSRQIAEQSDMNQNQVMCALNRLIKHGFVKITFEGVLDGHRCRRVAIKKK